MQETDGRGSQTAHVYFLAVLSLALEQIPQLLCALGVLVCKKKVLLAPISLDEDQMR